ncbi:MAG: dTMP kinase [Gammaproteobacteria bacterium]|nr:dTMP kinase [Gammaproteobacteria bacterium]
MVGKFITIEGIEGAGKSSAMRFIESYLQESKINFVSTREPGGTPAAEAIRQILLAPNDEAITSETELLLMFASRSQHVTHVILPALKAGRWVVSDRFTDASYAYQGGGRRLSIEQITQLEHWVTNNTQPDLTILLDVSPEIGLARAKHRGPHDRIEQEKQDFFARVRAVYLARAKQFPQRIHVIDASQSEEKVRAEIKTQLDCFL